MVSAAGSAPTEGGTASLREWAMTRSAAHRAIGVKRARALRRLPKRAARDVIERNGRAIAAEMGVSWRAWQMWRQRVRGAPEADWKYLLMPRWHGRTATAPIRRDAWEWFRTAYLSRRQPTVADCHRRLVEVAEAEDWGAVPSPRTFQRWVKNRITARERTLKRHGPEALARLFPSQRRDRQVFLAGEAVSGDGLKFDRLWVRFPDGEILNTTTGWFWQDIATDFVIAHALAKTETIDLFARATWELTGTCKPDHAWVDNTMVAASKAMTGRQAGRRWRGRKNEADPLGLLTQLGIEVHHTNPDPVMGNPGAKPVERAFGIGGIHEMVANHPKFAKRGWSRKTAVPFEVFAEVVAQEVQRFNDRTGRRTAACGGRLSFRQAWNEGIAELREGLGIATEDQRAILRRRPEVVTASKRTGEVALKAGRGPAGKRRYWAEKLTDHLGEKVCVWYDPEDLSAPVAVTHLDGKHIATAECLEDVGFADTTAAGEWSKNKRRFVKATKDAARARERMTAAEAAQLYPAPKDAPPPPDPGVVKGTFRRTAELRPREAAAATGTDGAALTLGEQADSLRAALDARLAAAAFAPEGEDE